MTIEPKLLSNISHKPIARDLWEHIRKRYRVSNGPRIQQLRREIANCQQVGLSIETYYGKLTKLWDSYNCYRPPLCCTCGKCTCDLSSKSEKQREEDKVHDFLMGLDEDTFGIMRSNLMSQEPLPTLEHAYLKVTQDEDARVKQKTQENKSENMAFLAQQSHRSRPSQYENKDAGVLCTNCNHMRHRAESCFQILGFPRMVGRQAKKPHESRQRIIFTCGKLAWSWQCRKSECSKNR